MQDETPPLCNLCEKRRADMVTMGYREDGTKWDFAVCFVCSPESQETEKRTDELLKNRRLKKEDE